MLAGDVTDVYLPGRSLIRASALLHEQSFWERNCDVFFCVRGWGDVCICKSGRYLCLGRCAGG